MGWRDIKAKARSTVNEAFRVPVIYLVPGANQPPVPTHARILSSFKALGDMAGTSYDYAEIEAMTPKVIFWLSDGVSPRRNALVLVSETEGYALGAADPIDGLTQTADAVPLSTEEAAMRWAAAQAAMNPVP